MFERLAWWLLFRINRYWSSHYMDQWDKYRFRDEYGTVYVSITRADPYPDSFDWVDENGRPIREMVPGAHELAQHVRRIWPDQADALLRGPAIDVVHFLNANTSIQVDPASPLGFTYWLPALRTMPKQDTHAPANPPGSLPCGSSAS